MKETVFEFDVSTANNDNSLVLYNLKQDLLRDFDVIMVDVQSTKHNDHISITVQFEDSDHAKKIHEALMRKMNNHVY